MNRLLVLYDKKSELDGSFNPNTFKNLLNKNSNHKLQTETLCYEQLILEFSGREIKIFNTNDPGSELNFDIVYIKRSDNCPLVAKACAISFALGGSKVYDREHLLRGSSGTSKLLDHTLFAENDIKTIRTKALSFSALSKEIEADNPPFEYPFIVKSSVGTRGKDNYLVKSKKDFRDIIFDEHTFMIAQPFIRNKCDYRLFVVENEVALIIKRTRDENSDTHTNNTSFGAKAELIDVDTFDTNILQEAVRAAGLMNRNIAGVDVIFDEETHEHYFLEVNRSPQTETGSFVELKARTLASFFSSL